ncbi:ATP-dependent helicase [Helcobacillus massiliensis]|uniref:ATP-dependent DNA helicase n=1 Tax=Helcobacillus massiliensis TaxID=521392 RepID=UPI0021A92D67|nr:ATP-dependent DNA helicase [Helcobacillus massiliensis]MCT1558230.1 ATP-dependent helicase [Helcobacillus massiliensis]MCT2036415.1 ATP-dependent helicase [Helcobacillus massiliensis]MCT2332219.1 ATP-dependent helicase [Helcobacillus massiliensis]
MTTDIRFTAERLNQLLGQHPPTAEQADVIQAPLQPLLVVAGAGSGKTETMSGRVLFLIANGLMEPRHILGLTFTRKAALELEERISARLAALTSALQAAGEQLPPALERSRDSLIGQRPTVQTYNGFSLDLVTEHALRIGIDPDFTVLTPAAAWQIAYEIVDSWPARLPFEQSSATIASAVVALSGSLADHLAGPDDLDGYLTDIIRTTQNLPLQDEGRRRTSPAAVRDLWSSIDQRLALIPLLRRFEEIKRERGAIDFSDQVSLAARIADTAPEVPQLMRRMHRAVLLDEFQDTSVAQLRLLAALFGDGHPTTAVGDPNQAIYGWRGASAASLTTFVQDFAGEDAPVLQRSLSTSWRNDHLILDAANAVSAPLTSASDPVQVPRLAASPIAGCGTVRTQRFVTVEEEADGIADWIGAARTEAAEDPSAPVPPSAAVLVRSRGAIPAIGRALQRRGIPFHVVGGGGLLHEPEVADVRALLECADSAQRPDAALRLLEGPRFALAPRDLQVLIEWRRSLGRTSRRAAPGDDATAFTLIDAIDSPPPYDWEDRTGRRLSRTAQRRVRDLRDVLRRMRRHSSLPLADQVSLAIRELGTDLALLADPDRDPVTALANLGQFRAYAAGYDASAATSASAPTLAGFLAFLDVSEDQEAGLAAPVDAAVIPEDAVTISTMHASKGLEWDMVAIAGLTDGGFPSFTTRGAKAVDPATGLIAPRDSGWLGALKDAGIPNDLRGDADLLEELAWGEAATQVDLERAIEEFRLASGAESLREERRLMYVALTRAKHALLLTSAAYKPDVKAPAPASRFLTETLTVDGVDAAPDPDLPEENPLASAPALVAWPQPPSPREASVTAALTRLQQLRETNDQPPAEAPTDQLSLAVDHVIADHEDRARYGDVHLPLRLSASDIVALASADGDDQRTLDLLRPLPRRPSPQASLGTQFHAWAERAAGAAALVDLDDLTDADDDSLSATDAAALAELREKFDRSRFAAMTPIAVEQPVSAVLGSAFAAGVIDAVFPNPDGEGVLIVDWKTGRVPSRRELRAKSVQLSIYRLAWHQATGLPLERIRTAFHYVAAEETVEVTDHLGPGDLEAMIAGQSAAREPSSSE